MVMASTSHLDLHSDLHPKPYLLATHTLQSEQELRGLGLISALALSLAFEQ